MDSGSQIVSMSERVALTTGLTWNPDICIHMQSANKQVEKTLGLARNVPFLLGDLTVYLQVHIIRDPAYDVLLGRPFDALTESLIKNTSTCSHTITLTDPNTCRRFTIPTFERGAAPQVLSKAPAPSVFPASMN